MSSLPTPELFRHYPELREHLAWVPLASPTAVHPLERLESYLRRPEVFVKRDDQSSDLFGGCMPRKLEFVFGALLRRGCRSLLYFGSAGSSETLAVSTFAAQFRLRTLLALSKPQSAVSPAHVQRVLQRQVELGAEMHRVDAGIQALWRLTRSALAAQPPENDRALPIPLWRRRTEVQQCLGYVNAAYELRRQINVGLLPAPKRIYVPLGSGALLAGLTLGCQLAQLDCRIVAVAHPEGRRSFPKTLYRRTLRLLRKRSPRIPRLHFEPDLYEIRKDFMTPDSAAAIQQARGLSRDLESLDLDATFTSRSMAALLEDLKSPGCDGPVLFWHTFARNLTLSQVPDVEVPRELQSFFAATRG